MIIIGAILWGASGPMMEWILIHSDMSVSFLLTIRLILAGAFLLSVLKIRGVKIYRPWKQKVWARQLLLFGVVGMLGVQFAFTTSIEKSSAVIATLFQFLAPIYIITFLSWSNRRWPPIQQILGIVVTIIGLFLLLTNGSLSGFALSKVALIWGIVLGFTFSFYTLYPIRLMGEWGVLLSVGWGMVIGGVTLLILNPISSITEMKHLTDLPISIMLFLIMVIGTVAFVLFLSSMKYITPIETSILSSFEPLTAIIVSVIWFGQVLGMWQLWGALIMLAGVTWISIAGSRVKEQAKEF